MTAQQDVKVMTYAATEETMKYWGERAQSVSDGRRGRRTHQDDRGEKPDRSRDEFGDEGLRPARVRRLHRPLLPGDVGAPGCGRERVGFEEP
jgi:hypothetical protein